MTEGTPTPPPPPGAPGGPPHGAPTRSFVERLMGALRLDAATYDEIEHDETALGQAAGVVAIAAVLAGIGGVAGGLGAIVGAVFSALIGWLITTALVWLIGVRFMGHTSDYMELLRTLGFAYAPYGLLLLAFVPVLGWIVALVAYVWVIAAYVVAVRQALDVETGRAVLVCVLAWVVNVLLGLLLVWLVGGTGGHQPAMMGG